MTETELLRQIISIIVRLVSKLRVLSFKSVDNYEEIQVILSALQNLESIIASYPSVNKLKFFAQIMASANVEELTELSVVIQTYIGTTKMLPKDGIALEWKGMSVE